MHGQQNIKKLLTLKESQTGIEFPCVWLNDLNIVQSRKSDFLIYNIHFS